MCHLAVSRCNLALYKSVDPQKVDAWRAEMDLEPLAAYLRRFEP